MAVLIVACASVFILILRIELTPNASMLSVSSGVWDTRGASACLHFEVMTAAVDKNYRKPAFVAFNLAVLSTSTGSPVGINSMAIYRP